MPKQIVSTPSAPRPLAGYSQRVKAGSLVCVSGEGPFHPQTGDVIGATIREQTAHCLRNVKAILEAAGSSMDKGMKVSIAVIAEP
ncbi:MAG: Rid family hydrolase [Anaerolineales bacterium]